MMDGKIEILIANWQSRNITGFYCNNKESSIEKILEVIPDTAGIGISGSVTLDTLQIVSKLKARGNRVFDQYNPALSREENLETRRQGVSADFYLASPNAISQDGELVFFSAYGNRTAGISYAKNVIAVAGINKITPDLAQALKRARGYSTPLNCKRLNWRSPCFEDGLCHQDICLFPEQKRMCCQVLIIEAEVTSDRLKVVLVGESLGF